MSKCDKVKLSELIIQKTDTEQIVDMENEHYITLSLYGKGARERVIKDGKYPVPFTGYRVSSGQFIYSRIDARNGAYAIIGPELDGFVVSKDFPVFDINESKVLPHFLRRAVLSAAFINQVKNSSFGATNRMRIKEDVFETYSIPLPELSKQNEIVDIMDRVETIINSRQQELQKLDDLIKARFVEMFGFPGMDPFKYAKTKLGSCCEINPKKTKDNRLVDNIEISFVPMTAVSEKGEIDSSDVRRYEDVKKGFTYFTEGDVLFAKITPCMENGKGAVAKGLKNGIGFGSTEFHVLRPIDGISNPYWVYAITSFKSFRKEAESNMTGSAGQRRTPVSFLENYKVSLPPIELQNQFADFVARTNKSKAAVQKSLDETQVLFDSLMQKYFG